MIILIIAKLNKAESIIPNSEEVLRLQRHDVTCEVIEPIRSEIVYNVSCSFSSALYLPLGIRAQGGRKARESCFFKLSEHCVCQSITHATPQ